MGRGESGRWRGLGSMVRRGLFAYAGCMPTNLPPPRVAPSFWLNAARFAALGLMLKAGCIPDLPRVVAPPPAGTVPAIWLTDTMSSVAKTYPAGAVVPSRPLEGQETRPDRCMFRAATYINGGCWVALAVTPPCVPGSFQHGNACYAPQSKSPDVPMSVTR